MSVPPSLSLVAQPDFEPLYRFSAWMERVGKSEATLGWYYEDAKDFVRACAPRRPARLQPHDVEAYLAERASAGHWSAATTRRHLQSIKAFYRYLIEHEHMRPPGPAAQVRNPVCEPAAPLILSEDDLDRLFDHLHRQVHEAPGLKGRPEKLQRRVALMDLALYGLCYYAALSVSEAVDLEMSGVRGWTEALHLTVVGRGGAKSRVLLEGAPAQWLSAWIVRRPRRQVDRVAATYVFVHPFTRVHTSRQRAWYQLRKLARAAGLGEAIVARLGPQTLRHSYAAHLAARTPDVATLREALHHRSPRHAAKYLRA